MNHTLSTARSNKNTNYDTQRESTLGWKSTRESYMKTDQEETTYPEFHTASWLYHDKTLKKQLQKLQLQGLRFEDYDFQASAESLGPENHKSMKNWPSIRWASAQDIFGSKTCLYNNISPSSESIRQGVLGNIYFTTALIALAQKPLRIQKLFS